MRVLPADVYDTLEFSALIHKGIGAGNYNSLRSDAPLCIIGHAAAGAGLSSPYEATDQYADAFDLIRWKLKTSGIGLDTNDTAVRAINGRKGRRNRTARVTFNEWCAELGVVRGE